MPMPIKVAVIEDAAKARKIFVTWLNRSETFKCIGDFASAEDAIAGIPALRPDIVLSDINLLRMNGVECVRQLKPLLPETQFVMITVYEDAEHIFQALQAGASGYLLKQTPREELLAALQQVRQGGSPMSPHIARKVVQSFQQPHTADPGLAELSTRELEVLNHLAGGLLYKEIADQMHIAIPTVNSFIRRIYEKLQVRSRAQAVAKFNRSQPASKPF